MDNRQIDVAVAEKVMRWKQAEPRLSGMYRRAWFDTEGVLRGNAEWSPSTDPAASKQLEDRLLEMNFTVTIWLAAGRPASVKIGAPDGSSFVAEAVTVEAAKALAALRAVGVEVEGQP